MESDCHWLLRAVHLTVSVTKGSASHGQYAVQKTSPEMLSDLLSVPSFGETEWVENTPQYFYEQLDVRVGHGLQAAGRWELTLEELKVLQ